MKYLILVALCVGFLSYGNLAGAETGEQESLSLSVGASIAAGQGLTLTLLGFMFVPWQLMGTDIEGVSFEVPWQSYTCFVIGGALVITSIILALVDRGRRNPGWAGHFSSIAINDNAGEYP